ncbi:MAG TPA: cytochrome bc complex cytochrome b subunit [Oceanithermus profundus]|uniref:Cytochrome bc complex cytochrome b subunit n=1 Tax=Oceanithermus profundus TaxID=187137 RepID=A0A7C4V6G0_9DEIN|nr:cytochrome bc complex cytochrome b subunit [Oceanithermus profundus]
MYRWLDERLSLSRLNKKYMRKAFPVHHSFFLGEITMFSFITLVLTGVFLTFNYEPSIRLVKYMGRELPAAYASILYIDSLPFGAVLRSVHHWSANVMIGAAFLHMLRILVSGAYKKPREINWLLGLALLGLSVVTAFTGYSLPFDAFSVTATQIGYGIGASMPYIGEWVSQLIFGGEYPTLHSIPRVYSLHVLWFPLLLLALIGAHMLIMLKQKHTQPVYAEKVAPGKILGVPMMPQQGFMMGVLFLLYLAVVFFIGGSWIAHPVEAFGPPTASTPAVKPDWYFLWIYGILQIIPGDLKIPLPFGAAMNSEFIGGVLVPGLLGIAAVLLPFLDVRKTKQRYMELPTRHPVRTSVTFALLTFMLTTSLAGWKEEFGFSNGQLWTIIIVGTLATFLVSYLIITSYWGQAPKGEAGELEEA